MKKIIIIAKNRELIKKEMNLEECIEHFDKSIKHWGISCYNSARQLSNNIMDEDDFYSEGMMCLMRVFEKYEPKNTFSTNLHKSLDNLRIDLFRKLNSKKRKTDHVMVYLNEEKDNQHDIAHFEKSLGYDDNNLYCIELKNDMKVLMNNLNLEERTIFKFLLEKNTTKRALSEKLNTTRPTLDSKIRKTQNKVCTIISEYFVC